MKSLVLCTTSTYNLYKYTATHQETNSINIFTNSFQNGERFFITRVDYEHMHVLKSLNKMVYVHYCLLKVRC